MIPPASHPIPTPCIGLCELGPDGYCVGCHRTGDEIARWLSMSDTERRWYMEHALPQRESKQG